jgi:hypothetical protein
MLVARHLSFGRHINALLVVIEWYWEMHGGMKTYRGSAADARSYVEADRWPGG